MKKFLTTTGTTYDLSDYLEDAIRTRFIIDADAVPLVTYGLNKVVNKLKEDEARAEITSRINTLISEFNNQNSLEIKVENVDIKKTKIIVTLNNSGNTNNYEINRTV